MPGASVVPDRRTGNLMALATNDVDAVEMAAGEALLAGFDGSLTLEFFAPSVADDPSYARWQPG